MDIKVFKLVTGEEILGELIEITDKAVTLKNPVAVVMQRMQNGETGLGFMPFMAYVANKTVVFNQDKIILAAEVDETVSGQYNTIFGAGIVVPSKTLITG